MLVEHGEVVLVVCTGSRFSHGIFHMLRPISMSISSPDSFLYLIVQECNCSLHNTMMALNRNVLTCSSTGTRSSSVNDLTRRRLDSADGSSNI